MATKKLRTKCSCHAVAFMIAAIVAPLERLSRARTVSCLVLRRAGLGPSFLRFAVLFGCLAGVTFLEMLLCDITRSFRLQRQMRRHHRSPTVAALPAGRDPRPKGLRQMLIALTLCLQWKSRPLLQRKCVPAGMAIQS